MKMRKGFLGCLTGLAAVLCLSGVSMAEALPSAEYTAGTYEATVAGRN